LDYGGQRVLHPTEVFAEFARCHAGILAGSKGLTADSRHRLP
jgi:hypothetical protein